MEGGSFLWEMSGMFNKLIKHFRGAVRNSGMQLPEDTPRKTLANESDWELTRVRLQESLQNNPNNATLLNELGQVLLNLNKAADAIEMFRQALQIDPALNIARSNLGQALRLLGRLAEAEQILREAVNVNPADPSIQNRLGTVLRERGRSSEAERHYREALRLSPGHADVLNNLGALMNEVGKMIEAEQCFRSSIASDPKHAMAQCNLGLILSDRGLQKEAEQCFLSAVKADQNYFSARMSYVMNKLAILYEDETEVERSRLEYQQALQELHDWLPLDDESTTYAAAETVGWVSPFYLAYQGKNDRALQAVYGSLICEIMARRYPEFVTPPPMPPVVENTPLRIGIVSAYFADHSNWKTPIRGWIENIDRNEFQVFGYYTGFNQDNATEKARQACHEFIEGLPFEALARKIRDDALHVLIFPEIGMDPVTTKLATLRLAPVQCNSWGHPDTSGMPTIDYYLSSDLMEPENGQASYTEKLVRLPNISIHYTPPCYDIPQLSRKDFGLREDNVLYCCAQSLFKYLPQFDFIFPRIAECVDNAQFVFFSSQRSADLTDKFTHRIIRAFERKGLDASRYVVVMPRMDYATFQAAAKVCDVYLDSVEWSGCNTTLESLVCNLPVITYRGSTMRGRHTYAFLKMMGFDELIADDLDAYIELAVQIGQDQSMREHIRSEISVRLPRIYDNLECIRALEQFLRQAVNPYHLPTKSLDFTLPS
jgi:protein O-GlcNAc transferase